MKIASRIALAAALVAAILLPATAASAAPEPKPPCVHRICLVVVALESDSDGDGYPDIDEIDLGSDPNNPSSTPKPQLVIDLAIDGKLPSFENHITEMVVFPQLTPTRDSYATAVGLLPLPGHAWEEMTLLGSLEGLRSNGLEGIEEILAFTAPRAAPVIPGENTHAGYMSLVANGSFAKNWRITPKEIPAGQAGSTTEGNGSIEMSDGRTRADGQTITTDYAADGRMTGRTAVSGSHDHDNKDLSSDTSITVITETVDEDGHVTKVTTHTESKVKDEKRTETVEVTVTVDGEEVMHEKATTEESCPNNACNDTFTNPDYIEFALTPVEYAKVAAKLNSIQTPGPDTGLLDGAEPVILGRDVYSLFTGDGVVVLATEPVLFNRAQPEYDPFLQEHAPAAGSTYPLEGADPYGGPGDTP